MGIYKLKVDYSAKKAIIKADLALIDSLKVSEKIKRQTKARVIRKYAEWVISIKNAIQGLYINTDDFRYVEDS